MAGVFSFVSLWIQISRCGRARIVRIRIYGIMGFSGFYRRAYLTRQAFIRARRGGHLVRIRIYGIMGFSGFYRRVFDAASACPRSSWLDFRLWIKEQSGRIAILKIPTIPLILILTKAGNRSLNPARYAKLRCVTRRAASTSASISDSVVSVVRAPAAPVWSRTPSFSKPMNSARRIVWLDLTTPR